MPTGSSAVVTGAGGVIGRTMCLALAARGVSVLAVDYDEDALDMTVKEVSAAGAQCVAHQANVTVEAEVAGYVEAALRTFGSLDGLANNAGVEGPAAPLDEFPTDAFRQVLDVNVVSIFLGLKHAMPVMRRAGGGRIVNTASVAGLYATPQLIAYGASKHAVIGLTRTAAVEGASDGIVVNALCPGPQESRMMDSIEAAVAPDDPATARANYTGTIPFGRYGHPKEIAETLTWLLTDAPPYLTGQTIVVDGGLLIS